MTQILIENGAEINSNDMHSGLSPLHYAAMRGIQHNFGSKSNATKDIRFNPNFM